MRASMRVHVRLYVWRGKGLFIAVQQSLLEEYCIVELMT